MPTTPRKGSASSTASHQSQSQSQDLSRPPGRLNYEIRHTDVSIFTGRTDGSASPSTSNRPSGPIPTTPILSPGSIDRVFPIRSAVSIDPNATPMTRHESNDGYPGFSTTSEGGRIRRRNSSRTRENSNSPITRTPPASETGSVVLRRSDSQRGAADISPLPSALSESGLVSDSGASKLDGQVLNTLLSDRTSLKSTHSSLSNVPSRGSKAASLNEEESIMTARFKHVVSHGGHAVITGRDGETLQRCEDEPIHIPGAVQSFGLLLAFKEQNGKLIVRIVSENSSQIIGYTPQQLFALDNFLDIFTEEQADNLLDHLDFIRDDDAADVVANGPEVFMLSIRPPHHRMRKLWCAVHVPESDRELVVCEFEVEDDQVNPLVPIDNATPEPPEDTLGSQPTAEEYAESTVNASKPLRVLRSARKKRGEAAAMEVFNIMSQVQEQIASAPTLQQFLKVLIGVVKELTGFHRVMIYQFDQRWNGRVVAELVDPRATKDLYKGLNFPASDIPKQARDMYKINKVRLLYDRDQETARLVCRTLEDLERPLDLTHAYLRAMSPIHIKYLGNMAVRSSMSISINAFGELWGLIACHTYGSKGMRVSFPIRKMCRLVGDTASRNIERLSYASRLQARKLINTTSSAANPSGYIVASSEDLLSLFDADTGALSIRDETKIMGKSTGHLQEILAMVEYLRLRKLNAVTTSQDIQLDFPDLRYAPGLKYIAGVLYVPLSQAGNDFIVFFRKGVAQEVKWAGNPYEKFVKEGTEGYLEPRKSFKTWSETIVGRCRDWTEEQVETASVLCLVYGKFIEVWRQKEAALQNSQLTRLLLANSAHEVRTPLNHIINYLEIALEGTLDHETRDNLAKSHSASKSLVYVINDLLDLTKAEGGQMLVKADPFNLSATLKEATDPFIGEANRKSIKYSRLISDDLPTNVIGDPRRVRQVVSNLVSNAIQHTSTGSVTVSVAMLPELNQGHCEVEIIVEDTGAGMAKGKVDALFRELEEVSYELDVVDSQMLEQDPFTDVKPGDKQALGLGLAVVARTIRTMNGQLRLKTEEGKGSRFTIQLGFDVGQQSSGSSITQKDEPVALGAPADTPSKSATVTVADGEVLLVDRHATKRPDSAPHMIRRTSADSMHSLKSVKSGKSASSLRSNTSQRSDADRLIDAIQEPFKLNEADLQSRSEPRSHQGTLHPRGAYRDRSPSAPLKSSSIGSPRELKSAIFRSPGEERITDSGVPLRAVRIPDMEQGEKARAHSKVVFEEHSRLTSSPLQTPDREENPDSFSILVAEDDPVNSRIMKKRLEKLGYSVRLTVNGEECSSAHGEQAAFFDAVLMDLQMPIVDGFSSTKMIRSSEKTQSTSSLSTKASQNGRIPIFAVSASLVEKEREKYIESGFDGWILKPVDFKRVEELLKGIVNEEIRNDCLYEKGKWEQGGWFEKRRKHQMMLYEATTRPSEDKPTAVTDQMMVEGRSSDPPASEGSLTPRQYVSELDRRKSNAS